MGYMIRVESREKAMDSLLLRPSEAADALGISRSALYELMGVGVLRGVKIGASRRIPRDELESSSAS